MIVPKIRGVPLYYFLSAAEVVMLLREKALRECFNSMYDPQMRQVMNERNQPTVPTSTWYPRWYEFGNDTRYRIIGITQEPMVFADWWRGPTYPDIRFENLIEAISSQTGRHITLEVKTDIYSHLDKRFKPIDASRDTLVPPEVWKRSKRMITTLGTVLMNLIGIVVLILMILSVVVLMVIGVLHLAFIHP